MISTFRTTSVDLPQAFCFKDIAVEMEATGGAHNGPAEGLQEDLAFKGITVCSAAERFLVLGTMPWLTED